MKTFKVINNEYCLGFAVGETIARCYVQKYTYTGVMYFSLETGIQQIMYKEDIK